MIRYHKSENPACLKYALEHIKYVLVSDTTAAVTIETQQSSTNGSFVASFGCDGDLDTFSLTNAGSNQWWYATLDKEYHISWIYVRIKAGNFFIQIH